MRPVASPRQQAGTIDACWNRIGVRGDESCAAARGPCPLPQLPGLLGDRDDAPRPRDASGFRSRLERALRQGPARRASEGPVRRPLPPRHGMVRAGHPDLRRSGGAARGPFAAASAQPAWCSASRISAANWSCASRSPACSTFRRDGPRRAAAPSGSASPLAPRGGRVDPRRRGPAHPSLSRRRAAAPAGDQRPVGNQLHHGIARRGRAAWSAASTTLRLLDAFDRSLA